MSSSVQVPNKSGTYKRFRNLNQSGVEAWRESYDAPKRQTAAERKAINDLKLQALYQAADNALGYACDGGDPIDQLGPYMRKHGFTMEDVNRLYRKHHRKNYYEHLEALWDDLANAEIADAKVSPLYRQEGSEFYKVKNGEVIPKANPWKAS
jgi:hypothetical protein